MTDSPLASSFKQATLYRVNPGRFLRVITLHDMEAPEGPLTAENCQSFFASPTAGGSAHYCTDTNSVAQCVWERDQAAHAPGVNTDGIGIEMCGYARQSREEWLDESSMATMRITAELCKDIHARTGIPLKFLTDEELLAGKSGICTHAQVSRVYKRSDHTDPGEGFPVDVFEGLLASSPEEDDLTDAEKKALFDAIADTQARVADLQAHVKSSDHGLAAIKAGSNHLVEVLGRVEVAVRDPKAGLGALVTRVVTKLGA